MDLTILLKKLLELNGSDLHLKVGSAPKARIKGVLVNLSDSPTIGDDVKKIINTIMTQSQKKMFLESRDSDFLHTEPELGYFRTNVFQQSGKISLVMRHIPFNIKSIDDLKLSPVLKKMSGLSRGLVLVTGTTGSGKSTTLAAMIDHINTNFSKHIITIEDPIEFVHQDKHCLINQRGVGHDTPTFAEGLRRALRQDPDVILIGEMRDFETISAVITAAETGHLVFSTVHTTNAPQTVERILNTYPGDLQEQIRLQLSLTLSGVISQRLLPRKDEPGRVAALEIMVATPTVRKLILDGETGKLRDAIADGETEGMQTFNQVLLKLYLDRKVDLREAVNASDRSDELLLKIRTEEGVSPELMEAM